MKPTLLTLDEYFSDHDDSRALYQAVAEALSAIGEYEQRVTKSQVAFRRQRAFAWVWMPGKYVRGDVAPLVLTLGLRRRDVSPRWKEVVEPRPGLFTHHLELYSATDIDVEVLSWLREAWGLAA